MPADLDQFGGQDSHRAIIGWKRLVKLGHVPADARSLLNQINFKTSGGKIKRSLDTADAAADNQNVSIITAAKISGYLLNDFLWQYFVSHYLSPHLILWVHRFRIYSLPDKVFGRRYQSSLFNNVLFVHLIQGAPSILAKNII